MTLLCGDCVDVDIAKWCSQGINYVLRRRSLAYLQYSLSLTIALESVYKALCLGNIPSKLYFGFLYMIYNILRKYYTSG